jgi:hypothetical protein
MTLLGKEVAVLNKMYGCDCCSRWLLPNEEAVVLCYRHEKDCTVFGRHSTFVFKWECLDCQGVSA